MTRRRRALEERPASPLWTSADYLIAVLDGPKSVTGFTYRGLGMHEIFRASPKGRRPPTWSLSHLGTGHRIFLIDAHIIEAFDIATEIAECSDFDFDSLEGWKDRDPEQPAKLAAIMQRLPKRIRKMDSGHNHDVARQVAEARA